MEAGSGGRGVGGRGGRTAAERVALSAGASWSARGDQGGRASPGSTAPGRRRRAAMRRTTRPASCRGIDAGGGAGSRGDVGGGGAGWAWGVRAHCTCWRRTAGRARARDRARRGNVYDGDVVGQAPTYPASGAVAWRIEGRVVLQTGSGELYRGGCSCSLRRGLESRDCSRTGSRRELGRTGSPAPQLPGCPNVGARCGGRGGDGRRPPPAQGRGPPLLGRRDGAPCADRPARIVEGGMGWAGRRRRDRAGRLAWVVCCGCSGLQKLGPVLSGRARLADVPHTPTAQQAVSAEGGCAISDVARDKWGRGDEKRPGVRIRREGWSSRKEGGEGFGDTSSTASPPPRTAPGRARPDGATGLGLDGRGWEGAQGAGSGGSWGRARGVRVRRECTCAHLEPAARPPAAPPLAQSRAADASCLAGKRNPAGAPRERGRQSVQIPSATRPDVSP